MVEAAIVVVVLNMIHVANKQNSRLRASLKKNYDQNVTLGVKNKHYVGAFFF